MAKKEFRGNKITGTTATLAGDYLDAPGRDSKKDRPKLENTRQDQGTGDRGGTPEASHKPGGENIRPVRKTFLVHPDKWDRLLDFIHTKKLTGEYRYSQEKALDQALDLLFGQVRRIRKRPQEVRDLETYRSEKIKAAALKKKIS